MALGPHHLKLARGNRYPHLRRHLAWHLSHDDICAELTLHNKVCNNECQTCLFNIKALNVKQLNMLGLPGGRLFI